MYTAKIQCKNSTHCVLVHSMTIYMWACTQYLYNNSYLSLGRLGKIVNKDRIRNEGMRKYLVKVNINLMKIRHSTLSVMHVHCVYIVSHCMLKVRKESQVSRAESSSQAAERNEDQRDTMENITSGASSLTINHSSTAQPKAHTYTLHIPYSTKFSKFQIFKDL